MLLTRGHYFLIKRQEKRFVAFLTLDSLSTTGIHYSAAFAITPFFQISSVRHCPALDAKRKAYEPYCDSIVVGLSLQHFGFEVPQRSLFSHSGLRRSRAERLTCPLRDPHTGAVCGMGQSERSKASLAPGGGKGGCVLRPPTSWSGVRA